MRNVSAASTKATKGYREGGNEGRYRHRCRPRARYLQRRLSLSPYHRENFQ